MPFGFQALHDALGRVGRIDEMVHEDNVLDDTGVILLDDIQGQFGHYQPGWPDLSDETQAERARLGYAPDDPLLREGTLRDAYTTWRDGPDVVVGVPPESDQAAVAEAQEFGTDTIPPRPVLGPVVMDKGHVLPDAIGRVIERAIKG